ncbi:MAG: SurA N-terminal domain-containing protein [Alloprevotella sp.]|nr:SurA N-terminal domain-containing protein [Alloprevotella sp.]
MAALQSIRSKGALLIGVIGLALFAFIAEEFFRSFQTTSNMDRMKVGEVYGRDLSYTDFQQLVEEQTEIAKLQKSMAGQGDALTDQEQDQIRDRVWQDFITSSVIEHEAEKLGIRVTEEDEQNALRTGQSQSLQILAQLGFANQQTGQFDVAALQDFLKNYDKNMKQMLQAGNTAYAEQYQQIRKVWDYTEKQLRKEILSQKYGLLLSSTFISNPVTAKMNFDDQTVQTKAEVVALPYSTVADKDVKVEDADLKELYAQYKELFRNDGGKTANLKILDVTVTPSEADREALMNEVKAQQEKLLAGEDPASVVGGSKTIYTYSNLAMSKGAFRQMPDVSAALDSMAVGSVKPAYFNAQDNTITTLKLVSKVQAADSVLYRRIVAVAATPEESATRADSILKAVQGGAKLADLAKKYGQPTDSVWMVSRQYEGPGLPEEDAKLIGEINQMEPGVRVFSNTQGSIVVEVLQRKNIETKYNVAVVKCPLNFSKETYNTALNKINRFLADNRTLADIEKNAAKAGYILSDQPNYTQSNLSIQENIGGSGAKDAMRWVFEEAKAGSISKLYECGRQNDHLLVLGVKNVSNEKYLSADDANVKEALTQLAKQKKQAALLLERTKGVKDLAAAKALAGAVTDTVSTSFLQSPQLNALGVAEPKLGGVIARTADGKFTGPVAGAAAIYFAQVQSRTPSTEAYDEKTASEQAAAQQAQTAMRTLLASLIQKANVKDNRYKF